MISKRIYPAFAMIVSVMLLLMSNVTVFAISGSEIDMDETGSISITIKYENNPVAGGSLTLYNVASISLDDGNLSYVLTSDFLDFETDFSDISSDTFAKDLKNYADANKLEGKTEEVDEDGKVLFEGLNLGLYLMVQKDAADGYYEMNPFVVSVPDESMGKVVYNVDASPKTEIIRKPVEPPETETTTVVPTTTAYNVNAPTGAPTPTVPTATTALAVIPQTGLLIWPVLLLAMVGFLLMAIGWRLKMTAKVDMRASNEA